MTPLCSVCDNKYDECHFCRGQQWCVPPPQRASEASDDDEMADVDGVAPKPATEAYDVDVMADVDVVAQRRWCTVL